MLEVSVLDHGALGDSTVNNPQSDDTAAFVSAAAEAASLGVPLVAPGLPGGRMYRLTAKWLLNTAVQFSGHGYRFWSGGSANQSAPKAGTWLWFDHADDGIECFDAGNHNAKGWALKDFAIWRNQPTPGTGWEPAAAGYDVVVRGGTRMRNVHHMRSTYGTRVDGGVLEAEYLSGQTFKNSVHHNFSADINRLDHLHFWPFWSQNANVKTYQVQNTSVLTGNRCDGLHADDVFGIWCHRLVKFDDSAGSVGGHTMGAFELSRLKADGCGGGVEINSVQPANTRAIYGNIRGLLVNADGSLLGSGKGVSISGTNKCIVTLDGFEVTRCNEEAIHVRGAAHEVAVSSVGRLEGWNAKGGSAKTFLAGEGSRITFAHMPHSSSGAPVTFDVLSNFGAKGGIYVSGHGPVAQMNFTPTSGVLTIPDVSGVYGVLTEGGAASDEVHTINGGVHGQLVTLASGNSSMDTTLKKGAGNLILNSDMALNVNAHTITLRNFSGSHWREVSRSLN